jgi:hypothetical protein
MNFREWLLTEGGQTSGKTGLYPLGYGGIGLYPPAYFINKSADALYYMDQDDRIYHGQEGGKFDITHIPGKPTALSTTTGEKAPWDITGLPGSSPKPNSGDGGKFKISHIPK